MYGKMKEFLSQTLAEIKEAGLYKEERLIESAQQAAITVKGQEVLNFCANNYLGLSNLKQQSPITSIQKTLFYMQLVSTLMVVYSNPCSPKKMPSFPTH